MKGKSVEASSTKRKKHPQGETPSPVPPIVNVPFLEIDSSVLEKANVQKALAKKIATLP